MYNYPYWSWSTLFLYLLLSIAGMYYIGNNIKYGSAFCNKRGKITIDAVSLIIVWAFFATFRFANGSIGGSDTLGYIWFFEHSFDKNLAFYDHSAEDLVFLWTNQLIRFFTKDYHLFFFIIYSFMAYAFIKYCQRFCKPYYPIIPLLLVFFLYLRAFMSIRSNYSFCFVLLGLVSLANNKYKRAYLLAILACLTHKGCILYAMSIPFCHFFRQRNLPNFVVAITFLCLMFITELLRDYIVLFTASLELGGVYSSYAENANLEGNAMFYTPSYGQYFLGISILLFSKEIHKEFEYHKNDSNGLKILWLTCIFDLLALPLSLLLGNWRAYEFLYMPRVCMWCLLLFIFVKRKRYNKRIVLVGAFMFYLIWIVYRLNKTYEDSGLMPYVLDII